MTTHEAMKIICEKIGQVYDHNFPCICGANPLSTDLNSEDMKKLEQILAALDLIPWITE